MRPERVFEMVLRETKRADLAVMAFGHAVQGRTADYFLLIRAAESFLSPALYERAPFPSAPTRMIDGVQAAGLMHALLTGYRPRPSAHLDADELEMMLTLHKELKAYTPPHLLDDKRLGAAISRSTRQS